VWDVPCVPGHRKQCQQLHGGHAGILKGMPSCWPVYFYTMNGRLLRLQELDMLNVSAGKSCIFLRSLSPYFSGLSYRVSNCGGMGGRRSRTKARRPGASHTCTGTLEHWNLLVQVCNGINVARHVNHRSADYFTIDRIIADLISYKTQQSNQCQPVAHVEYLFRS
jgi:hypothetical protein